MANEKMIQVSAQKMSLADVLAMAGNKEQSKWGKISASAGTIESVLTTGTQLHTEDIMNEVLTVERVEYAEAVDKKTGEHSVYPVMTFAEKPNCYYNSFTLLTKNINEWMRAAGDDYAINRTLPNLNEQFAVEGGPQIIIYQKEGKDYYSVYVM